jgi:hypothetical protein
MAKAGRRAARRRTWQSEGVQAGTGTGTGTGTTRNTRQRTPTVPSFSAASFPTS